tara:strand:+ start:6530 stop:6817 length:288 start_codon:yes stop_codon:yes gene_type:complete
MRKITEDAIRAFRNGNTFKRDNTEVRVYGEQRVLRLHDSDIAVWDAEGLFITNCGYKTVTTKERLNGLPNVHIVQKDFQWFLNGEAWDGELVRIP